MIKKTAYSYLLAFLILVAAGAIWTIVSAPEASNVACGVESCHGLEVSCGSDIPSSCTDAYQIGDRCREFITCGIQEGVCQEIANEEFTTCADCVERCLAQYNDPEDLFRCESTCGPSE